MSIVISAGKKIGKYPKCLHPGRGLTLGTSVRHGFGTGHENKQPGMYKCNYAWDTMTSSDTH